MASKTTPRPAGGVVIDEMSFSLQAAGAFDWALQRLLPRDEEIELAEFVSERERREQECSA
jgi:hypothetical protein